MFFNFGSVRQMIAVFHAGGYGIDFSAELAGKSCIVGVKRFKNHNFVIGVAQSHNSKGQGFAASVGDENIACFIVHAFFGIVFLNCFN